MTAEPTGYPSNSNITSYPASTVTPEPSTNPTFMPSNNPTFPTAQPTIGTADGPTINPTMPSLAPSISPLRETPADITIYLTIFNETLSKDRIINIANESIKTYFNDTDIEYVLIADLNDGRSIILDVYIINDVNGGNDINGAVLQNTLEQNIANKFRDDVLIAGIVVNNKESSDSDDSEFEDQQRVFQELCIIISIGFLFIIATSWIDAKFIRKNDFYQIGPLFGALFHVLDTYTDIFFALQCVAHPYFELGSFKSSLFIILLLSVIFIIVPMAVTLYQLYDVSSKKWSKNDELRGYLSGHLYSLYMVSIICGSAFAGIKLFRSRLFNLSVFDIPLSKQQSLHFETKKVYSTILLENVPQLILACWYIVESNKGANSIVFLSMGFSVISIIVTIILLNH